MKICSKCRSYGWEKFGENFFKDEYYARMYGGEDKRKKSDGDVIGMTFSLDVPVPYTGGIGSVGVFGGPEVLTNKETGDKTLFLIGGVEAGAGWGSSISGYSGSVYNLNKRENVLGNNINYAGNFKGGSVTYITGMGFTTGRATFPGDDFNNPEEVYANTLGFGLGAEGSASVNLTEYIPIATWNSNGVTWNVDNYFLDPNFGSRGIFGGWVYHVFGSNDQ